MGLYGRISIPASVFAIVVFAIVPAVPAPAQEAPAGPAATAAVEQAAESDDLPLYPPPKTLVEWFGLNVGAGYISNTESYLKIDATLFTVSQENWYYTIAEGGLNPVFGVIGIGGRAGYQKFFTKSMALRAGLKLGFARWLRGDPGNGHRGWSDGIELAPHLQLIWLFHHTSVGIGIDFPIMTAVSGLEWDGPIDARDVDSGVLVYFRWSVY